MYIYVLERQNVVEFYCYIYVNDIDGLIFDFDKYVGNGGEVCEGFV